MFHGIDTILQNIPAYFHIRSECGDYPKILRGILSVLQNNVMKLNNVITK